jgi:hypothetical protein
MLLSPAEMERQLEDRCDDLFLPARRECCTLVDFMVEALRTAAGHSQN